MTPLTQIKHTGNTGTKESYDLMAKTKTAWINTYLDGVLVLKNRVNGCVVRCLIDNSDKKGLERFNWRPNRRVGSKNIYIETKTKRRYGPRKNILIHRYILKPIPGECVDHINHDPFDNRRCNLRAVTIRQNACNRITNKSGYPCVFWNDSKNKWVARFNINKMPFEVGLFKGKEEAAYALWKAGVKMFGDNNPYKNPFQEGHGGEGGE